MPSFVEFRNFSNMWRTKKTTFWPVKIIFTLISLFSTLASFSYQRSMCVCQYSASLKQRTQRVWPINVVELVFLFQS